MEWLKGVAIALLGLIVIFGAGLAGYAFGQIAGYNSGYELGYEQGSIHGAGSGYTLRNPTYSELKRFLQEDETDDNEYIEGVYTCTNFASDLNNNAEEEGFRAAYVYMEYPDAAHSLAAFQTVDRGLVFIEPQSDDEVVVSEGTSFSEANGYSKPSYDDTITRFVVTW